MFFLLFMFTSHHRRLAWRPVVMSINDLSRHTVYLECVSTFYSNSKKQLSTENYHHNIKWWLSKTSVKQHLFSEVDWWKNNGTERRKGRTGSGRRERRNLKPPCGWQWILLPKNFPFSKHFTYHYVNLIMHWGWVKVLHRNAVQCVYVLRFPWSKWNT